MSDRDEAELHYFVDATGAATAVALPFSLPDLIADWGQVQRSMVREMPAAFRRDEWAYLMSALSHDELVAPFLDAFGKETRDPDVRVRVVARPRGMIAVWLPANVSLLGPLVTALLVLTGSRLRLKGTARATDLTSEFLEFARRHAPKGGALASVLAERVEHEVFDREDERNATWAAEADMRVLFGSREAAAAIERLPHPVESLPAYFVDRRSEAWLHRDELSDDNLRDVVRVFAVYGQAGCTSPGRLVVLDGSEDDAVEVRDRMLALWSKTVTGDPPPHAASANVLAWQWALANGWSATRAPRNAAVLAAGSYDLPMSQAALLLPVVAASEAQALAGLPANVQTLGVASPKTAEKRERWRRLAAATKVLRVVPLREMHRFGSVWDGRRFWADAFELVETRV